MGFTSRERVVAALNHSEADLVPIDFGSTRSTGINALAYHALKRYLSLGGPVRVYDVKQLLADPDPEVLALFQSDCVQAHRLSPSAGMRIDSWKSAVLMDGEEYDVPGNYDPARLPDGSYAILSAAGEVLLKRPSDGLYFDDVYAPLADASDASDIDGFSYPTLSDADVAFLARSAEDLYTNTDSAIVCSTSISIFERGIKDFGYEEYLVRIMTDQDLVIRYLERLTESYLKMLDQFIAAVGSYAQVLQFNDDLGAQNSTLLPPQVYRDIFKPFHTRIFQYVKEKAPHMYTMLHSCGSIYDLIPDLIEAGVDALNPVQISAGKMDPTRLKQEFGDDITFWGGGCSTQTTLTFGTVKDVQDEVKRLIDVFAPGGGFVFNQVHNIQANVPPEKILALYETAVGNRSYGG